MRPTLLDGMKAIEVAFRDLEAIAQPPTDARDLRKGLAAFTEAINKVAQDSIGWSTDIRVVLARKDDEQLQEVLLGKPLPIQRQAVGAADDESVA